MKCYVLNKRPVKKIRIEATSMLAMKVNFAAARHIGNIFGRVGSLRYTLTINATVERRNKRLKRALVAPSVHNLMGY